MFEYPRLQGSRPKPFPVHTRLGTPLDAFIGPQPSHQCRLRFASLCQTYGKNWHTRKNPCGGYNCAGLVWASRRAALPEPADWERILVEDGYRRLRTGETPEVGDIVLYRRKAPGGEILHVGRVCKIDHLVTGSQIAGSAMAAVLSKWDLTSGESIHRLEDVFLNGGEEFVAEIHTDRDDQHGSATP